jgi:DNA-binding NarL/FixJ family response regulator
VVADPAAVRVLIADDQPVVREGCGLLLEAVEGFEVVGCANDWEDLLRMLNRAPDVVVLDLKFGGEEGLAVAQRIKLRKPDIGVMLFPKEIGEDPLERALACGVSGIILKSAPVPEFLDALATVGQGGVMLGRDLAPPSDASRLSPRERDVLRLLVEGLSNREISRSLYISIGTTKSHLESIARKLGTTHRAAAVAEAIRRGLVA